MPRHRRTFPDGTKECAACHAMLPLTAFYVRRERIGQWNARCKDCLNAARRTGPRQFPAVPQHKVCTGCQRDLPITAFYPRPGRRKGAAFQSRCKECLRQKDLGRARRGRKAPTREQIWARNLHKYGLSPALWLQLLARQSGLCGCCAGPSNGKGRFHIDHDHRTGEVRALLCHKCNTALGLFDEDVARIVGAIAYLQRFVRA